MCKGNEFMKICFVLSWLFASMLSAMDGTPAKKTYQDYPEWEMLPKCDDFEDEAAERAYQRLVEEGEAGHEALLAIVRECEDMRMACLALSILRASDGDKRKVVMELKELLLDRLPVAKGDEEWLMTSSAEALAAMGDESDMEALVSMLSHSSWRIRVIGARCIGQQGGQNSLPALGQANHSESNALVRDEIGKAISAIESRLAARDAETKPPP